MNGEPSTLVSPGIWGFIAFFVLAIALYLLMRNMNARMRRMSYRAEELRRQAEEEQRGGGAPVPEAEGPRADERRTTDDDASSQEQTGDPGAQPGSQSHS